VVSRNSNFSAKTILPSAILGLALSGGDALSMPAEKKLEIDKKAETNEVDEELDLEYFKLHIDSLNRYTDSGTVEGNLNCISVCCE
jgi:hypothetical protein